MRKEGERAEEQAERGDEGPKNVCRWKRRESRNSLETGNEPALLSEYTRILRPFLVRRKVRGAGACRDDVRRIFWPNGGCASERAADGRRTGGGGGLEAERLPRREVEGKGSR